MCIENIVLHLRNRRYKMENANTFYALLGEKAILEVVNHFYSFVYEDPRIAHLFQNNIEEVKDKQFRFLCQFFGGPSYYSDKYGHPRMRMRHMPHNITSNAKDAWLENMKKAIHLSTCIPEGLKEPFYQSFPKIASHMVNS